MQIERSIEQIKERIIQIGQKFNWIEIVDNKNLTEALKISDNDKISHLKSRENYLLEERHNFIKLNLRYIKYQCVDNRNKYTSFYNAVRKVYEDAYPPKYRNGISSDLWQVLDLAIMVMESDLYCSFRGEVDLFWHENLAKIYDSNQNDYFEHVPEFINFIGLLNDVDDYRLIGIIEKDYGSGTEFYFNPDETDEKYFIIRDSVVVFPYFSANQK